MEVLLEFRKITEDSFKVCIKLSAGEKDENYVAPNTISLAQAYVAIENKTCTPLPFGIYRDEVMVGFIMMSYIREDQDDELDENIYEVWRFMIDENHQDKGYGKEALLKAVEYMKTKPEGPSESCFLSYVPGNEKAEGLYKKAGFTATGKVEDGEIQMKLRI